MKKHRHYHKKVGLYYGEESDNTEYQTEQARQCKCGHVKQTGMTKWRKFVETGKSWRDYFANIK